MSKHDVLVSWLGFYWRGSANRDVLEDDDDDEDEDDGDGDFKGQVRNVYRGAREVLEQQVTAWPTARHLVFDYHEAMDENPTRFAPLKDCFLALAHLSEAVAGFTDGPASSSAAGASSSSSSSSSSMPASPWTAMSPSAATSEMAELLGRPTKNIADLLVAAAEASSSSDKGRTVILPQKLWSWLLDMIVFHSSDLLGHMALICAKHILKSLPPASTTTTATSSSDDSGDACLELWDLSRPLMFEYCCRPLIALGLNPMNNDPTSGPDRPQKPNQGLRASAPPRFARPLFPGPALVRCLELWAFAFGEGRHTVSGEECLDVLACVVLMGIDPWALSTRGLQIQRDECLCALLRILPTSIPSVLPSIDAPRAEATEDVTNRVWPEATIERMTQIVQATAGAEARLLLLRSIPLAANHGRGRVILAKCACDFASEAFPPRRPPSPAVSAAAADSNAGVGTTAAVETVSSVEARHLAAVSEVASRLLTESNDAYLQRVYSGQASSLAGQGPRALGYLLGTADMLLAAASELGELSVPRFNGPMIKLLERVNGFLRMNIDPEVMTSVRAQTACFCTAKEGTCELLRQMFCACAFYLFLNFTIHSFINIMTYLCAPLCGRCSTSRSTRPPLCPSTSP